MGTNNKKMARTKQTKRKSTGGFRQYGLINPNQLHCPKKHNNNQSDSSSTDEFNKNKNTSTSSSSTSNYSSSSSSQSNTKNHQIMSIKNTNYEQILDIYENNKSLINQNINDMRTIYN